MKFSASQLIKEFRQEYGLQNIIHPLGQDVTFLGSELECYKMAYRFKSKESLVSYSENLKSYFVNFPYWFPLEFSSKIA